MSSVTSPVRDALEGYVAGRVKAERVVEAVAAEYYGDRGLGPGAWLKPLMEIIERAHPGVIELSGSPDKPGFAVRLSARPFPKQHEAQLREAVAAVLVSGPRSPGPGPRFWTRLYTAVRKFFTAST
jgi:hypothetical protein